MGDREQFLISMYRTSWQNVSRAEDAIWKGMAAYTAVFAGLALAVNLIGLWGFLNLVVVFGLFGMAMSQNANLWFVRNIGMISNLEREFLQAGDYGRIIPVGWKEKVRYRNDEIWWIMTLFFFLVSLSSVVIVGASLEKWQGATTVAIFAVGVALVADYAARLAIRHRGFVAEAQGKS